METEKTGGVETLEDTIGGVEGEKTFEGSKRDSRDRRERDKDGGWVGENALLAIKMQYRILKACGLLWGRLSINPLPLTL